MSLSERVRGLSSYIAIISDDATLLETGRKSRSPAIRKNLSILQKECASLRKQCLETQKALPTKSRPPKVDALQPLNTQAPVEVSRVPYPTPAAEDATAANVSTDGGGPRAQFSEGSYCAANIATPPPAMLKLKRTRTTKRAAI